MCRNLPRNGFKTDFDRLTKKMIIFMSQIKRQHLKCE